MCGGNEFSFCAFFSRFEVGVGGVSESDGNPMAGFSISFLLRFSIFVFLLAIKHAVRYSVS